MKIVIVFCGIFVLLAIIAACSKKQEKTVDVLNYDNMILLDAEELGEGRIGEIYQKEILPVLQKHVKSPAQIIEELDSDANTYKVTSQGRTYNIGFRGRPLYFHICTSVLFNMLQI
ncbi:MAG: hypothetical protein PHI97_29195 [Desulfobulbus sp.]|nr:hypothetical protein [Desulfobulbus sp.]